MLALIVAAVLCELNLSRVSIDIYDSLEVLERGLQKPATKHIKEAKWTSVVIRDDEYPTLQSAKNNMNGTFRQLLWDEWNKAKELYNKANVQQSELYYHPAGPGSYGSTMDEINKAERVKVRLTIDSHFGVYHFSGIYIPPGEVVTIEIPEVAKGRLQVLFNQQSRNCGEYGTQCNNRLPGLYLGLGVMITLNNLQNTVGWPFGGLLSFHCSTDQFSDPIQVIVSGGILTPWFRYGLDTEEDWETIRNYPGAVACFETGNIQMVVPSSRIRNAQNVSLAMSFFRASSEVMDSVTGKAGWANRRASGRESQPNMWYFDAFVAIGEACAYAGGNICCMPLHYIERVFWGKNALVNCWGPLHEMGHHHQNGWEFHDWGEVTNNVLLMICYSYWGTVTYYRTVDNNGNMGIPDHGSGWDFLTHGYQNINNQGALHQWCILLHCFGQAKLREFIYAQSRQMYYNGKVYGWDESYTLRAALIFGYDLRPHMKFHGWDLDSGDYNKTTVALLDKMNLKPWYPVINAFQTGYEVNGSVFQTARPFRIPFGRKYVFNFTRCTRSRPGQGNFEIVELKPGRKEQWKQLEYGVYEYTPLSNASETDDWRLVYHETTTDQTTIAYGQIKYIMRGNEWSRFLGIKTESGTKYSGALEAYNATVGRSPNNTGTGSGLRVGIFNGAFYVTVCKGTILAPATGTYTFYAKPDEYSLLYLSDKELAGDPNEDAEYLILEDDHGWRTKYNKEYGSSPQDLTEGQRYYYCLVIYNTDGDGGGQIGYIVGDTASQDPKDFPDANAIYNGVKSEDLPNEEWIPTEFEDLKGMDAYYKAMSTDPIILNVDAPREQEGRPSTNLHDGNTNEIYVTRWNPASDAAPYPQDYSVNFITDSPFDYLKISGCPNRDRDVVTENLTITCGDEVLYDGPYDSRITDNGTFHFDYPTPHCSSLKISFSDNSNHWSDQGAGVCLTEIDTATWFSASKIIPISSPFFKMSDNNWESRRVGSYYNGIGKYGTAGSTFSFKMPNSLTEFVIVGDKWQGTGTDLAAVYVNGELVGKFTPNLQNKIQYDKQYKTGLFALRHLNFTEDYEVEVRVESGSVGIAGIAVVDNSVDPPPYVLPDEGNAGLSPGAKAGIAIAVILIIAGISVGVAFLVIRYKRRPKLDMDLQV